MSAPKKAFTQPTEEEKKELRLLSYDVFSKMYKSSGDMNTLAAMIVFNDYVFEDIYSKEIAYETLESKEKAELFVHRISKNLQKDQNEIHRKMLQNIMESVSKKTAINVGVIAGLIVSAIVGCIGYAYHLAADETTKPKEGCVHLCPEDKQELPGGAKLEEGQDGLLYMYRGKACEPPITEPERSALQKQTAQLKAAPL